MQQFELSAQRKSENVTQIEVQTTLSLLIPLGFIEKIELFKNKDFSFFLIFNFLLCLLNLKLLIVRNYDVYIFYLTSPASYSISS